MYLLEDKRAQFHSVYHSQCTSSSIDEAASPPLQSQSSSGLLSVSARGLLINVTSLQPKDNMQSREERGVATSDFAVSSPTSNNPSVVRGRRPLGAYQVS